ncbi:uncharacterized protein KD926_006880 [Aspergillus affinis]|uniref:uncharacterized protein n=1 Tax=Aspergillus affinis TaxID=1070780 RepID=UPI0022FDEA51|nr:uncharacterized protein KD926_006880 [Aspergillus affinis]KAI9041304.1 hypothetical protein KD926_006880 [Aspergillus affinis]
MDPTEDPQRLEESLDTDIASIRAESTSPHPPIPIPRPKPSHPTNQPSNKVRTLERRKRFLASSILSSSRFQMHMKTLPRSSLTSLTEKVTPLVMDAEKHTEVNHHRIAFSATTFPFKDPSPNAADPNLLGVRIDLCKRDGQFAKPYYLLLKRSGSVGEKEMGGLKVYKHTIPAFIPMEGLERVYLPTMVQKGQEGQQEEDDETALKPWKKKTRTPKKQDLQGLVRELRRQLVAWQLRMDAIGLLREKLGVVRRGVDDYQDDDGVWERSFLDQKETKLAANEWGIVSLGPTALEAVYVRVEWANGQVGRFKISNSGIVERAVVIGDDGRDKALEMALTGGNGRVETVLGRLKKHAEAN